MEHVRFTIKFSRTETETERRRSTFLKYFPSLACYVGMLAAWRYILAMTPMLWVTRGSPPRCRTFGDVTRNQNSPCADFPSQFRSYLYASLSLSLSLWYNLTEHSVKHNVTQCSSFSSDFREGRKCLAMAKAPPSGSSYVAFYFRAYYRCCFPHCVHPYRSLAAIIPPRGNPRRGAARFLASTEYCYPPPARGRSHNRK
jgi:hypothetical protein